MRRQINGAPEGTAQRVARVIVRLALAKRIWWIVPTPVFHAALDVLYQPDGWMVR